MSPRKPQEVAPGVYALGSEFVNWFLVEEDGAITAVDAGFGGFAKTLESDLQALGLLPGDIKAVVLTHSDADHTGVAPRLQQEGAAVYVHADDEDTLRKPRPKGGDASMRNMIPRLIKPRTWMVIGGMIAQSGGKPKGVEGAHTFGDGEVLDVPGKPRVVHTPGHTPGHCAFLFERHGALFVGDALCSWNPLTGRRGPQVLPTPSNVDTESCFNVLSRMEGLEAQVVLPGHGEPVRESPAATVQKARAAGRS